MVQNSLSYYNTSSNYTISINMVITISITFNAGIWHIVALTLLIKLTFYLTFSPLKILKPVVYTMFCSSITLASLTFDRKPLNQHPTSCLWWLELNKGGESVLKPSVSDLIPNNGRVVEASIQQHYSSQWGSLHNPLHETIRVRQSYVCIQELKALHLAKGVEPIITEEDISPHLLGNNQYVI